MSRQRRQGHPGSGCLVTGALLILPAAFLFAVIAFY